MRAFFVSVAVLAAMVPSLCKAQETHRWDAELWSTCSYTCTFPEMRTRVVRCRQNGNDLHVDDSFCSEPRPESERLCVMEPLRLYDFELGTDDEEEALRRIDIAHPHVQDDLTSTELFAEEWKYHNGASPSWPSTGPEADHSFGNSSGHYYYRETSFPAKAGSVWMDTVLIREEDVTLDSCQMSFWLSGNGAPRDLREFDVDVIHCDGSPDISLLHIDARDDDTYPSDGWHQQVVTLPTGITGNFRLRFSATKLENSPSGDWAIDDLQFSAACVPPSPSPTPSPTPSHTPSSTRTPSRTPSPSPSPSPSPTRTSSQTPTPTPSSSPPPSASPTVSTSPSASPTVSTSPSASLTVSTSPSVTPTVSTSHTASPTASTSPTRTPTASPSPSRTPTPTSSPSRTPSHTVTPSRTPSTTATHTPSASNTRTPTSTRTPSVTTGLSHSSTPTISVSPSATPSATPSVSQSSSPTPTSSRTPSRTATASASHSSSPSPSRTASPTATASQSLTPTSSPSPSTTASPSPSSSPSPSTTPSVTHSASVTRTPSSTRTPSHTRGVSPSQTPTPSPTKTPPPSPTSSPSSTPEPTMSPTASSTPAPSPTPTPTRTPSTSKGGTPTRTSTPSPTPSSSPTPSASAAGEFISTAQTAVSAAKPWIEQPLNIAALAAGTLAVCFFCMCCGLLCARRRRAKEKAAKELELQEVVVGTSRFASPPVARASDPQPGEGQSPLTKSWVRRTAERTAERVRNSPTVQAIAARLGHGGNPGTPPDEVARLFSEEDGSDSQEDNLVDLEVGGGGVGAMPPRPPVPHTPVPQSQRVDRSLVRTPGTPAPLVLDSGVTYPSPAYLEAAAEQPGGSAATSPTTLSADPTPREVDDWITTTDVADVADGEEPSSPAQLSLRSSAYLVTEDPNSPGALARMVVRLPPNRSSPARRTPSRTTPQPSPLQGSPGGRFALKPPPSPVGRTKLFRMSSRKEDQVRVASAPRPVREAVREDDLAEFFSSPSAAAAPPVTPDSAAGVPVLATATGTPPPASPARRLFSPAADPPALPAATNGSDLVLDDLEATGASAAK